MPRSKPPVRAGAAGRPTATVAESPTPEASDAAEPEPSESSNPEPTATTPEADDDLRECLQRGRLSAEVKYFGVTAKLYGLCVRKARRYHVAKWNYEITCRYDHTYRWSQTDDPNYDPYPDDSNDSDAGEVDDGNDYSGGDNVDDGNEEGDGHAGCTWVDGYYRKDGTHVRGYWRC